MTRSECISGSAYLYPPFFTEEEKLEWLGIFTGDLARVAVAVPGLRESELTGRDSQTIINP